MKSTVRMSRASGTVNGYTRAFNRWKEFVSPWGEAATFPAELLPVALYLQHLMESTSSCSSVDGVFHVLKWVHETARLVSPTDTSLVAAVREASKRILGTSRLNRKEPMPRDLLYSIIDRAKAAKINLMDCSCLCSEVEIYCVFVSRSSITME